jgi:hypothetical protein
MLLVTKCKKSFNTKRHIVVKIFDDTYLIDNNLLKIGYHEKSQPYDSKIIVQTMDPKYTDVWLDAIENAHRGFKHNNNTYYGYDPTNKDARLDKPIDNHWDNVPESIPYGDSISSDPSKILKKELECRWLDAIAKEHCEFKHNNNTYYGYNENRK